MPAVATTVFVYAAAAPLPERPWWAIALLVAGAVALTAGIVLAVRARRGSGSTAQHATRTSQMAPAQAWLNQSSPASAAPAATAPRIPQLATIALAVVGVVAVGLGLWFVMSPPDGDTAGTAATAPTTTARPVPTSARPTTTAKLGPRFVSANPDLCLAAASSGIGAPLIVARCTTAGTQRWLPADDGTIRLGELCMDVAAAETADNTIVQVAECNGNPAQQFIAEGGKLLSDLAGKCVDVTSSRVVQGSGIVIRPCDRLDGRTWTYVR